MEAFTKRNVAKWLVTSLIAAKTAKTVEHTISDHTRYDDDNILVEAAGGLVGWYVGAKAKPYTDKMVDKTADWINERKNKRNQDKPDTE